MKMPDYGTERFVLLSPKRDDGPYNIERRVWTDKGYSHFYDEEAKDFVSWPGSWQRVEALGPFETRDGATEYMRARRPVATPLPTIGERP